MEKRHQGIGRTERRRHDIDWLRILATYLVVLYHVAQVFDFKAKTCIKNRDLSKTLDILTNFMHMWHMPLFFLIAGWSLRFSLEQRGFSYALGERIQKLFAPLVFGMCTYCAVPGWVSMKHGSLRVSATGKLLPANPTIPFTEFFREVYYKQGNLSWDHLWFLAYLFTFTFLYLPLFWLMCRINRAQQNFELAKEVTVQSHSTLSGPHTVNSHQRIKSNGDLEALREKIVGFDKILLQVVLIANNITEGFPKPVWIAYQKAILKCISAGAVVVPLAIVQVTLRNKWPGFQNLFDDWANFWYYSIYFITGFSLALYPSFEALIHLLWKESAAVAAISSGLSLATYSYGLSNYNLLLIRRILSAISGWFSVVFLLTTAKQICSHRIVPTFWAESAFPVYLSHLVPMALLADVVFVPWEVSTAVKFPLLLLSTLAVTLIADHFLLNRLRLSRFLLGMKQDRKGVALARRM